MYSVEKVAQILDCEPETAVERIKCGDIPGLKIGRSWVIPIEAFNLRMTELSLEDANAKPFISDVDGILSGKTVAFFGVNPSTATATEDDATVRKWTGFCKRWSARRFIVGNVFAFRASDVGELATARDPVGHKNATHIRQIIAEADVLVPCWGDRKKVPKLLRGEISVLMMGLCMSGKPILHFGLTKGSDPKHPLMLEYDTPLVEWGTT